MQILIRDHEGTSMVWQPTGAGNDMVPGERAMLDDRRRCIFSRDGAQLAIFDEDHDTVGVFDASTHEVVKEFAASKVSLAGFSPQGTYLVTWERFQKGMEAGNLAVWDMSADAGAEPVCRFYERKCTLQTVQWSDDEHVACHLVSNEVQLFDGKDLGGGIKGRLRVKQISQCSLAPSAEPYRVGVFIPEKNGKPAFARVYNVSDEWEPSASAVVSKSFFGAEDCTMEWAPQGGGVLVQTSTSVDKTGASYYGSSGLHLLQAQTGDAITVPLTKDGPVHDVKWSPNGRNFVAIAGGMPANCTLHHGKSGDASFEFGAKHRNTISWAPHGRFLCLAGFGNLAGEMDFWDVNKKTKMGATKSEDGVICSWSPDSRLFMTATISPRLRVNNGYEVYSYCGEGPYCRVDSREMYHMEWKPVAKGTYPDRPASAGRKGPTGRGAGGLGGATNLRGEPVKAVGRYVPRGASGALSALMAAERSGVSAGKVKYNPMKGLPAGSNVPGMVGMAPNTKADKNKERRDRKKKNTEAAIQKATEEKAAAGAAGGNGGGGGGGAGGAGGAGEALTEVSVGKKIKGLSKKMKQITKLKGMVAAGEELNSDQTAKLATEGEVVEQIAAWEAKLKELSA
jgi:translation initiation factor 2A